MFNRVNEVIPDGMRGLLYVDGCATEMLRPGRHRRWAFRRDQSVVTVDIQEGIHNVSPAVEAVLARDEVSILEVPPFHLALVTRLQAPFAVLEPGRYALWVAEANLEIALVDLAPLRSTIPVLFRPLAGNTYVQEVTVHPFERALVYADGDLADVLTTGRHALSAFGRTLDVRRIDMREQDLQVVGQELMTRDKVSVRLNLVLKHRIVDAVAAVEATDVLRDALYTEIQLVARAEIAGTTIDEFLEGRDGVGRVMLDKVAPRAKAWGVEVVRLEIKDVILPGEMKTLLNRVIEAEKRAAAQNILRREEVAATRSLANTARLLENNPVLRRLKELEAYREIADRIPNLTVVVTPKELQAQLRLGDQ